MRDYNFTALFDQSLQSCEELNKYRTGLAGKSILYCVYIFAKISRTHCEKLHLLHFFQTKLIRYLLL